MERNTGPHDAFGEWFEREYPAVVGIARRVLDRDSSSHESLTTAEELTQSIFARYRRTRPTEDSDQDLTVVLRRVLDRLWRTDASATLPSLWRRRDRHIALLCSQGGYPPAHVAVLLELPLDEVLGRWARVVQNDAVA